jgi:hypothetical protein
MEKYGCHAEPGDKSDCAGEDQRQFTGPTNQKSMAMKMSITKFAEMPENRRH